MVWTAAGLALIVLVAEAHADTLYLKDGQTVWGTEVVEQGDTVIVLRPGETLRFSGREVNRIERSRLSIPRYFEPPTSGAASVGDRVIPPSGSAGATGAAPTAQEPAAAGPAAGQPTAIAPPAPLAPTRLPSPPPPPSAGQPR